MIQFAISTNDFEKAFDQSTNTSAKKLYLLFTPNAMNEWRE